MDFPPCIADPESEGCCDTTDPSASCYIPCSSSDSSSNENGNGIRVDPKSFSPFLSGKIPSDASNVNLSLTTSTDSNGNITFQLYGAYSNSNGDVTVLSTFNIGTIPNYETEVDNILADSTYGAYEDSISFTDGTVQNYQNPDGQQYAIFIKSSTGETTILPEAYITTSMSTSGAVWTSPNGTIHADNHNTLEVLEHEYGHYIQANIFGNTWYSIIIAPNSLANGLTLVILCLSYENKLMRLIFQSIF